MENNTNQTISLMAIFNAIKRNVLTIAYFLLTALLLGFVYAKLQPSVYSATAQINSTVILTEANNITLNNQLKSGEYLSDLVEDLNSENIIKIGNDEVTSEFLRQNLSGSAYVKNVMTFAITFTTSEKHLASQVVSIASETFVNYMKGEDAFKTLANGLSVGEKVGEPINIGISLKRAILYAVLLGGVISIVVIFVKDVFSGHIYDKYDLTSPNVIQIELDKKFRKITRSNFMSWPVIPANLKESLAEGDNKVKLEQLQDKIIADVGFDNNVHIFFSTTESKVHRMFLENYIKVFKDNDKSVLLINLDQTDIFNYEGKSLAAAINSNANTENVDYLDVKDELYPSSIVNSSAFLEFVKHAETKYDYVLINGGMMIDIYAALISKIATPLVVVYSGLTSKKTYNKTVHISKPNKANLVAILIK